MKVIKKEGDLVLKGERLTSGKKSISELSKINGCNYVSNYILNKIQKIYLEQGVDINNKHFEIILKKMLNKVVITSEINKDFYISDIVDRNKLLKKNKIRKSKKVKNLQVFNFNNRYIKIID